MESPVLLAVLGFIALIGVIIWLAHRQNTKRREALRQFAQVSGWEFHPDRISPAALAFNPFTLFSSGHSHRASNLLRSTSDGAEVTVFDHQYSVGHGKHRTTHFQTVAHVRAPYLRSPPFVLSAENVLHKLGGVFGYHDIDFPESPEFSSKYLLRSKEAEDRVRLLFTPALRLYFEQRPPLSVEGIDREMLVYRPRRRVSLEDLRTFIDDALAVSRELGQARG